MIANVSCAKSELGKICVAASVVPRGLARRPRGREAEALSLDRKRRRGSRGGLFRTCWVASRSVQIVVVPLTPSSLPIHFRFHQLACHSSINARYVHSRLLYIEYWNSCQVVPLEPVSLYPCPEVLPALYLHECRSCQHFETFKGFQVKPRQREGEASWEISFKQAKFN